MQNKLINNIFKVILDISLSKFLEEMGEYNTAVTNLRTCLTRLLSYRNE